jgi:hypothetical protein
MKLIIDDEKTINVVAGLIMPGNSKFFENKKDEEKLHEQHKAWIKDTLLVTSIEAALEHIKYQDWDTICLDYDVKDKYGSEITDFLKDNKKRIPAHLYIISFNPYGRKIMYDTMEKFYKYEEEIGTQVIHFRDKVK